MAKSVQSQNKAPQPAPKKSLVLNESSPFALKEAYKTLRTNILFSVPGGEHKVIAFTSGESGDGKTVSTINLAISFAQIGKRVLLMECDLRLPTIGRKLGIKSVPGLTNLLIGEVSAAQVIQTVRGIDVIPSGSLPKDPTGLLESKHIMSLVEKLKEYYDYVIIDTPPVTQVADALILSKLTDGFVIVVHHNASKKKDINTVISQLGIANANIIGFLYNAAPIEGKKYYKGYGHGEKR